MERRSGRQNNSLSLLRSSWKWWLSPPHYRRPGKLILLGEKLAREMGESVRNWVKTISQRLWDQNTFNGLLEVVDDNCFPGAIATRDAEFALSSLTIRGRNFYLFAKRSINRHDIVSVCSLGKARLTWTGGCCTHTHARSGKWDLWQLYDTRNRANTVCIYT